MERQTRRPPLELSKDSKNFLIELAGSKTASTREVTRAKVLLQYANGMSITSIKRLVGFSRPTIYKCIDKALAAGVQTGLKPSCAIYA